MTTQKDLTMADGDQNTEDKINAQEKYSRCYTDTLECRAGLGDGGSPAAAVHVSPAVARPKDGGVICAV